MDNSYNQLLFVFYKCVLVGEVMVPYHSPKTNIPGTSHPNMAILLSLLSEILTIGYRYELDDDR